MRRSVWRLRTLIAVLAVAQLVIAIGVLVVWLDGRSVIRDVRQTIAENAEIQRQGHDEVMEVVKHQLRVLSLMHKHQKQLLEIVAETGVTKGPAIQATPLPSPPKAPAKSHSGRRPN